MRLIIAGSRTLSGDDVYAQLKAAAFKLPRPTEIVSGGAKGADQLGERLAAEFGLPVRKFLPDWDKHGKGAGFLRNGDMAVYASEVPGSALLALWDGESRGTKQMIEVATNYGLAVHVVQPACLLKDVTPREPYIFPQSHSSLGVFETCPRQYEAKYLTKEVKFQQSPQAAWGDSVHLAIEARLLSGGATPLPANMAQYNQYVDWVMNRAAKRGGQLLVERKTAVTKALVGTEYSSKQAWIRSKIDLTILYPNEGTAETFDWKTNEKIKNDATQLKLYNAMVLADQTLPFVPTSVSSGYVWLKHGKISPPLVTDAAAADGVWSEFQHKYDRLRDAYVRGVFPPRPNGLCKAWCDVLSCPHNGKNGR